MRSLLIADGTVVTLGENSRVLRRYDVLCEGGRIARIAPHGGIAADGARVLDASGKVVLPGFINAHTHFYSSFARGLGKVKRAADFREVLENLWWRLDRLLSLEDCHVSAQVALLDAVRHGTTTLVDHHASPHAARGSLDILSRAVREVGVRACLCYELSDRDGPEVARDGIAENVTFIRRCRQERDPQLAAMFGLHAAFTLSDATLASAASAASAAGAGFHVHVAEAASDQEHSLAVHGERVVARLARFGVLGEQTVVAHGVHLDGHEIGLLAESGTAVAHNPQSNMNNAVGVADVPRMLAAGVLVGLGTDAMTADMLEELRAALFVRHLAASDPAAAFVETVSLLTSGNARIAERLFPGHGLGALAEGRAADVAVLDYDPPTPLDEGTLFGHLVFGISQARVDSTVVAGKVLMAGGKLELDLDEAEVMAHARERAASLWERF